MASSVGKWPYFSEKDLDFIVEYAAPGSSDTERLRRLVLEDVQFRDAVVGDEALFDRVINDDEVLLHVSPALYFEILLRKAHRDLEEATHTVERSGRDHVPVFDTADVMKLMKRPMIIEYLASMMASFTRVHSYVVPVRVRRGVRRRVRYNDMDVDSLVRFASDAEPLERFGYYKRIADVCLFVSGVFPNHTQQSFGRSAGAHSTPLTRHQRMRRSIEDYEREGRRFYALAQDHPTARKLDLSSVFAVLKEDFATARKPLTLVATRFLHARQRQLFGMAPS
jgi:hypothetical protein